MDSEGDEVYRLTYAGHMYLEQYGRTNERDMSSCMIDIPFDEDHANSKLWCHVQLLVDAGFMDL